MIARFLTWLVMSLNTEATGGSGAECCFAHAESQVPVGHLAGHSQQADRNMGVELGREDSVE